MRIDVKELSSEPGDERCDFCSGPDACWIYPCRSFEVAKREIDGQTFIHQSVSAWAACARCRALIESGDRDALALRTYQGTRAELAAAWAELKARLGESELLAQIRAVQDLFFCHRAGPARTWTPSSAKLALLRRAVESGSPLVTGSSPCPLIIEAETAAAMLAVAEELEGEDRLRFLSFEWPQIIALTERVLRRLRRREQAAGESGT